MAGILDKKQRVMDVLITQEGRRQVAAGQLNFRFASFTDRHAFYVGNTGSVAYGASDRVYFEASNRPQDQIIFETDANGVINSWVGTGDIRLLQDKILSGSQTSDPDDPNRITILTGRDLPTAADSLLYAVGQNFRNQYIIGTQDIFDASNNFEVNPDAYTFKITDSRPKTHHDIVDAHINNVESLFEDMRLSHLPNYRYLPPVNTKAPGADVGTPLGNYPRLNQDPPLTYSALLAELQNNESFTLNFSDTSLNNNIAAQMLEVTGGGVKKLAIIDFGEFPDEDPYSNGKRVFFLGKIFTDDNGNKTFVNIFTIIFD